jgi:hypothetical protein
MYLLNEDPRCRAAVENQSVAVGAREAAGWGFWAQFLTALLRALSVPAA